MNEESEGKKKGGSMRPFAAWLVVAGILTIVTSFLAVFYFQYIGTTFGFLIWLIMIVLGLYEVNQVGAMWGTQIGSWNSLIQWLGISVGVRVLWTFVMFDIMDFGAPSFSSTTIVQDSLFVLNLASLFMEITAFLLVFYNKQMFLPSPEEMEEVRARMKVTGVRTVAECPTCKDLVESDWCCCPGCGTALPKYCLKCGTKVTELESKCPQCGTEIVRSEALCRMVSAMKQTAEQPASPETRSVRYARYAEALLKDGQTDNAIEAYRKAIHFTQFNRKQTNFMVKMATIYNNTGRPREALQLLDAALELDNEDWASASKLRQEIINPPKKEDQGNGAVKA